MDRRQFLQISAATTLASSALAKSSIAQSTPATEPKKLKVDIFSRHLQWLRTADEVAEAATEMGFDGVDIAVRPYPCHVDPEKVAEDLPPFVNTIRKHGLEVVSITAPITDASSRHVEEILQTASSLGITHYWWGTFRYIEGKSVMQQLDELKPRVAGLAALSAKYKMTAMYHTFGGASVGASIWDLLYVLRNFDPTQVGFYYDMGHMIVAGADGTWATNLRAAGPYVAGVVAADAVIEQGTRQPAVTTQAGHGSDSVLVTQQNSPEGQGRGRGRGRGGFGGRGRGGPMMGNNWRSSAVPLGTGMDNLPLFAQILKGIGFSGPVEIQSEYPNGGANDGQDEITLPRDQVLGAMKRDLVTLRTALASAGLS